MAGGGCACALRLSSELLALRLLRSLSLSFLCFELDLRVRLGCGWEGRV